MGMQDDDDQLAVASEAGRRMLCRVLRVIPGAPWRQVYGEDKIWMASFLDEVQLRETALPAERTRPAADLDELADELFDNL